MSETPILPVPVIATDKLTLAMCLVTVVADQPKPDEHTDAVTVGDLLDTLTTMIETARMVRAQIAKE